MSVAFQATTKLASSTKTACWGLLLGFCCRYRQFICHSEIAPEETSLCSSVEPPRFDRWDTHRAFACPVFLVVLKLFLASPSVVSSFGSYALTRWETQKCSDLWVLLETGKVPDRSPAQGEYRFWLKAYMPRRILWSVLPCLYYHTISCQLSSVVIDTNNVSRHLSFSVSARRIKETKPDKIWRWYGINKCKTCIFNLLNYIFRKYNLEIFTPAVHWLWFWSAFQIKNLDFITELLWINIWVS